MKYKELKVGDNTYSKQKEIENILKEHQLFWLIDAEIENAEIEIKNDTIIWNNGIWLHGDFRFGIWKNGIFHGVFENGIFEGGEFKGEWESGINFTEKNIEKDEEN
jgi:hypothetical protein